MTQIGKIEIKNQGLSSIVIDIEGTIGMAEELQFEDADQRIATYEKFTNSIEKIKTLECDSIRVNIRSTGGNLNDALLIFEALCSVSAAVETHCYGYVASAATIIAQAASRGARYVSSGSLYLIHNSRVALEGTKEAALRTVELLGKSDEQIASIYADRSGMPREGFLELMNADGGQGRWLTPDEAVGYGLADEVEKVNPLNKLGRKIKNLLSRFDSGTQILAGIPPRNSGNDISSEQEWFIEKTGGETNLTKERTKSEKVVDNDFISLNDKAELRQWGNYFEELALTNQALTDKVEELEADKNRRLVMPTRTMTHQDPAPVVADATFNTVSGNSRSYDGDLANFS